MKKILTPKILSALLLLLSINCFPQGVSINTTSTNADPSAMLDVSATDAGLLIPRMTKLQRNAISLPAEGLMIYQTDDTTGFWYFNGNNWKQIGEGVSGGITAGTAIGNTLYWDGNQWVESSNIFNYGGTVGIGTNNPDNSAAIHINSHNKGALIPRLTTSERNNIGSPAEGLLIFNITSKCFEFFSSSSWLTLSCGCFPPDDAGVITGDITVCQGQNNVNYSVAPIANANGYIWTIPQGSTIVSGANTNSIVVNFSGSAVSGDISVYGTSNSCGNGLVSQNFHVTVVPTPTAVVASASPITVCEGQSLTLTGSASGATDWSWTGPNGYTSNDQNPSPITNISSINAGVYTLVASNGICSAQPANTTSISVIPIPTSITASANPNPLCEGETLTLTGSATGATSWSWTGPNGFTSNDQNPSPISGISTAEAGVYSLVAYNGSCAAPAVNTANISVKPAPIADAGPDHSVVECGKIIGGNPTASGGVSPYTYQWSPTTALSSYTVANPTASPSSTTAYTVTVTGANGCASTSSMTLTIGNGTPVVFNSSQSWVVPAGVTCVQIEVWGGGGGGGGAAAGCGGGGGGYGRQNFNVTPGQSLNITVGAGGPGGGSYKGTNGNTSSVNGTGIAISATGGSAGSGGKCSGSPPGGTSTATINVTGGSGSGGNGSNKGGNGGNGGNGGSGGSGTTGYGNPGQIPGGGGGGGGVYGGDGANGRVTISY